MVCRKDRVAKRGGAAAVELALLLTFILLPLLMGLWEVGRMIEVQQLLDNAAREGGRQASTGQRSVSDVQQAVVNYLALNGVVIPTSAVTVTNLTDPTRNDPRDGSLPQNADQLDHFRIVVTVPFDNVRWVLLSQITPTRTLGATVDWYSMNNIPLVVTPTIPAVPQ
jgi:Flp pilus assembly protein TadG